MILEVFSSGPIDTHAYLLACSKTRQGAVIDVPPGSLELLEEKIEELQLTMRMILLTHSHWDHFGDAAALKEKLKVPLYIHQEDAGNIENPGSDRLPLFFPIQPVTPDGFLEEGQVLSLGELKIRVIHTPGHTPGGVCFYVEEEKLLISGDTLFCGTMGNLSLPTARPTQMWESLKRLAMLPKDTRVYPGHGEPTTIGYEQWMRDAEERFT